MRTFYLVGAFFLAQVQLVRGGEVPTIEAVDEAYKSVESSVTCLKRTDIKNKIAKSGDKHPIYFWESSKGNKDESFVYFDRKLWTLSVCDRGKIINVEFEGKPEQLDPNLIVDVSQAHLSDLNGDGKTEFIVGYKQCVEGPCIGNYYLLQIEGNQMKKVNVLKQVTLLNYIGSKDRPSLKLENMCFNSSFGSAFEYFSVAEFDKNGKLVTLPFQEIRRRFPVVLKDYVAHNRPNTKESKIVNNPALSKLQGLIIEAYQGKGELELVKKYNLIAKDLEALSLNCSPLEILRALTK